jgi:hypothetical protein
MSLRTLSLTTMRGHRRLLIAWSSYAEELRERRSYPGTLSI